MPFVVKKVGAALCKGSAYSHMILRANKKWPSSNYVEVEHFEWVTVNRKRTRLSLAIWTSIKADPDITGKGLVVILKRTYAIPGYYRRKFSAGASGSGETGEVDITVTDPTAGGTTTASTPANVGLTN